MSSAPDPPDREELIARLGAAVQRAGRHTVFFHTAVAERLGISAADSRVLSYVQEAGPVPAGELAALTGLTTGAVTGVIDRLERAGFVTRGKDPSDRRKVLVSPVKDSPQSREMGLLFAPLGMAFHELASGYDGEDLRILIDFVTRATEMLEEATERLLEERAAESGSA